MLKRNLDAKSHDLREKNKLIRRHKQAAQRAQREVEQCRKSVSRSSKETDKLRKKCATQLESDRENENKKLQNRVDALLAELDLAREDANKAAEEHKSKMSDLEAQKQSELWEWEEVAAHTKREMDESNNLRTVSER